MARRLSGHEPSNHERSAGRPGGLDTTAGLIVIFRFPYDPPEGTGGIVASGPDQSVGGPGGTREARARRTMPRTSSSSRRTRAAAISSGSRVIVEASQSM